jgi:hypothetical protein
MRTRPTKTETLATGQGYHTGKDCWRNTANFNSSPQFTDDAIFMVFSNQSTTAIRLGFRAELSQRLAPEAFDPCLGRKNGTICRQHNAGTAAEAQAFKRACACFGLGRYLYYFTGIWISRIHGNTHEIAVLQSILGRSPRVPSIGAFIHLD